ncbi:MAG: class I SAM-dependent methyltransferase [Chloroflexota bacterium]|nr:class I SAM-dependent methyltransferase [Chloroflexota bacterium]MDE2958530.1 class I SAM-dependent methyltransferase [Chloroflexota bacterium]
MPNPSLSRFSERETEEYYDAEDALYRSFWDAEGSLHWGVFESPNEPSSVAEVRDGFLAACSRLNAIMLENSGIDEAARVLDLGCGNGNTATWLCRTTGAHVAGIDLSGVRIANAIESLNQVPELAPRLEFHKASATELPFADGAFSHVWSQATIYHIPDKAKTLQEAYRVLQPGGVIVFDDLTKPKPDISDEARTFVYDRLLFDTDFSFYSYMDALRETGFRVLEARDLSTHLARSYSCLSQMAASGNDPERTERFAALSDAYLKMVNAVRNEELGWAQYRCVK